MTPTLLRRIFIVLLSVLGSIASVRAASTALADAPVLAVSQVPPNVMMTLSVEWPTGTVAAYNDNYSAVTGLECPGRDSGYGICYVASRTYLGYFDPLKCYTYSTANSYFSPDSTITLGNTCGGKWSGNYLNWVSSHAIDEFRYAMTGGDRYIDTATNTVIEKANHTGQGGYGQFPPKRIQTTAYTGGTPNIAGVAPSTVSSQSWSTMYARVTNDSTPLAVGSTRAGRVMQFANNASFVNAFPASMRFIKIQLSGNDYLSLAEVQIYGAATGTWTNCASENGTCTFPSNTGTQVVEVQFGSGTTYFTQVFTSASVGCNKAVFGDPAPGSTRTCSYRVLPATDLALNKSTWQTSNLSSIPNAYLAVDGNTDGNYGHGSLSHTADNAAYDAWQVDLGSMQAVRAIVIWNRTDCCANRLNNFYVYGASYDMSSSSIDTLLADSTVWKSLVTTQPNPSFILAPDPAFAATDYLSGRVQVCNSTVGLESNCTAYGNNYKPTGIMQNNAAKMRFGVVSYLNVDGEQTMGGVVRSGMKYIGPNVVVPNGNARTNPQAEILTDGTFAADPQGLVANDIVSSGAVNYINKFGKIGTKTTLKSYDNASELFYEALNYMRGNSTSTPAFTNYTGANTAAARDGFPAFTTWTPSGGSTASWIDNVSGILPIDKQPIQYSCQKTYLVGIGDTNTWCDSYGPGNSRSSSCSHHSGAPTDSQITSVQAMDNLLGAYEDTYGTNTTGSVGLVNGSTLGSQYVDSGRGDVFDIAGYAFWANTHDIFPNSSDTTWASTKRTAQTYWVDVRESGSFNGNPNPKNQYWLAGKYGGFPSVGSYTDSTGQTYPSQTAPYNPLNKNYFTGDRPDTLIAAMQSVFNNILASAQTNSAAALTSNNLATNGADYIVKYDPSNWTGDIIGQTAIFSGGTLTTTTKWNSMPLLGATMDPTSPVYWSGNRRIVTYNSTAKVGAVFEPTAGTGSMSATQLGYFGTGYTDLINYLRGQTTYETGTGAKFRSRTPTQGNNQGSNLQLGDIVNSAPIVVGPPSDGFTDNNNPGYSTFATNNKSRNPVLFVGSNDGMIHAIDARVDGSASTNGSELFAYIPSFMLSGPSSPITPFVDGIASRANSPLVHKFLVDGQLTAQNVDFGRTGGATNNTADWHTILVGGLGKGGRGFYALDVTSIPAPITSTNISTSSNNEAAIAGKVLWEYTDSDMGYSYGKPIIAKTARSGWVVILSSGYNNNGTGQDGQAYIVILNAKTGALIQKVAAGSVGSTTTPAGLAQLAAFAPDRTDLTIDAVYGGDLLGNVWRFDLGGTSTYTAPTSPLTSLVTSTGAVQPITAAPAIGISVDSLQRWVFVGTGQLLDPTDEANTTPESLYAIKDGLQAAIAPFANFSARSSVMTPATTLTTATAAGTRGWYYDFTGNGERLVTTLDAELGIIAFATQTPTTDPCKPGVSSNVYALNYATAQSDFVNITTTTTTVVPFATASTGVFGVAVTTDANGQIQILQTGSNSTLTLAGTTLPPGAGPLVKLNWREILQ